MLLKIEDIDLQGVDVPAHRSMVVFTSRSLRGLQFKAKSNGRREWHLRYTRFDGARTSVKLGDYPDIDYQEALEAGQKQKAKLKQGVDPVESSRVHKIKQRQAQITAGLTVDTPYRLSNIITDYLVHIEETLKVSTVQKYRSIINVHILPSFGGWDIRVIDIPEYEEIITQIAKQSKSAAANTHRVMRALLSYAVDKNRIQANPLKGRKSFVKRLKVEPRRRYLSSVELNRFINEIDEQNISDDVKTALNLQLLTGLRIGEILSIEWPHINFKERIVSHPGIAMKSGDSAETVLSDNARRLLLEWKRETKGRESDRVFTEGLDTSHIVDEIRKLKTWIDFGTHDIRRTVRTYLQQLGCPEEIRKSITNHAEPSGVAEHYDQGSMEVGQLHWLTLWAGKLDEVKEDPTALESGITAPDEDPLLAEFGDVL